MRKTFHAMALGLGLALSLSACQKQQHVAAQQAAVVQRPANPDDVAGWQQYLGQLVQDNRQGVTTDSP